MNLELIAIACVAFIFGSLVGVLLISMFWCNERDEDCEASYEDGYETGKAEAKEQFQKDFEAVCSHCGFRKG